jgi:glycosyltransferase involved in cell wall biosynthesis
MSVILLVGGQRARSARALRSVSQQSTAAALEVLILDVGWRDHAPLDGCDHPSVRVLQLDRGLGLGAARACAIVEARGPVVAFLEEHCVALPGWADAHLKAHQAEVAAVGGELHNATPGLGLTEFISMLGEGPWTPPARRGPVPRLAGNNSSYKRDVLLRYREDLPMLLANETLLYSRLRRDGLVVWLEPDAKYTHAFEDSTRQLCTVLFWYGWIGEATRWRLCHWSLGRRACLVAILLVTMPVLPARPILRMLRSPRRRWDVLLPHLPVFILAHWSRTLGRIIGLVVGLRRADVHRLDYDVNTARRTGC